MKLQFLGANRQVTGSRYLLRACGTNVLVDCGLFQERQFLARNWEQSPVPPRDVDVLLLTHAHLDHCGLIPKFVKEGFRGDILATAPTMDLARIVWEDSARIQVEDAAYKQRRHEREGRRGPFPEAPLYTPDDARVAMKQLKLVEYDKEYQLSEGLRVIYRDAGHIIGSAMLEVFAQEDGVDQKVVFSGDVGMTERLLLRNPHQIHNADYIVMESTYGDRDHKDLGKEADVLERVINETIQRGGNLIIPTFAIDRAQEILYLFSELVYAKRIPQITVFFDSPMAIKATTIYKTYQYLLDDETRALLKAGKHPFQFPGLHFVRTHAESISINSMGGSSVILAGSGMCTGGRIKHHLRNNIGRPESTILFAGFQAQRTLGRRILHGDPEVRIHGKKYTVRAKIEELHGLSAHADRTGLMNWLSGFKSPPKKLFLTHGEIEAAESLAKHIRSTLEWEVDIPEYDSTADLQVSRKPVNRRETAMPEYSTMMKCFVMPGIGKVAVMDKPIPDELSDEQAAYCCDMPSTGFIGAEIANIPIGGSVVVFAQGPVGLMATVGARLRGAGLVIGVESMPNRIALARKYGCDVIIDHSKEDPVEAIMKITGGKGVDSAIEALGSPQTFAACVSATRPGGTISNVGYHGDGARPCVLGEASAWADCCA